MSSSRPSGPRQTGPVRRMEGYREAKGAEEALLTSQFRLSDVMDLAKIVYWELDPDTET